MNRAQASAGPALMKREKWDCLCVGGTLEQSVISSTCRGKEARKGRRREGGKNASVEKQLTMHRGVFTQVCVNCRWPRVSRH